LIKFFIFGISEETPGIYGYGGGNTTLVVLITLGYLAGFYIFYRKSKIFVLLSIFYVLYGIVGAKAALLILIPLEIIIIYYLCTFLKREFNIIKQTMILISILLSIFIIGSVIIKYNTRLNKERKIGGAVDYSYAFDYIKNYTMAKNPYDENISIGRASTFLNVTNRIWNDGYEKIFLGYGPGSLTPSIFKSGYKKLRKELKIGYGITGTVYILAEYGILGFLTILLIFLIFIRNCWNWVKNEKEPYWKAIAFGSLIFTITNTIVFLIYNEIPVTGDLIPPIYFYFMFLMFNRHLSKVRR
jgi:O-antigen ligase